MIAYWRVSLFYSFSTCFLTILSFFSITLFKSSMILLFSFLFSNPSIITWLINLSYWLLLFLLLFCWRGFLEKGFNYFLKKLLLFLTTSFWSFELLFLLSRLFFFFSVTKQWCYLPLMISTFSNQKLSIYFSVSLVCIDYSLIKDGFFLPFIFYWILFLSLYVCIY